MIYKLLPIEIDKVLLPSGHGDSFKKQTEIDLIGISRKQEERYLVSLDAFLF